MYLFTRRRRIDPGHVVDAMGWTTEITASVGEITGRDVSAWTVFASPELGTVVWSMWVEHLTELEVAGDTLAGNAGYMKLVEKGAGHFDGPLEDSLSTLIHGAPDLEGGPPNYVAVAAAVAANGRVSDAIAGAIEIATTADSIASTTTMVSVASTGPYGGIAWITAYPDIAALEASDTALSADSTFLGVVDKHGASYAPNATQTIYRRVA